MSSRIKSKIPNRRSSVDGRRSSTQPACRQYRTPSCSRITGTPQTHQTPLTRHRSSDRNRFGSGMKTLSAKCSTDLRAKSPNKLKQQYTNLNEKFHLPRIEAFVIERSPKLEVLKPVTINTFVCVCELLLSLLYGPSQPSITTKNYKTDIPIRMKQMGYPITIASSFLKCPNTPQNFTHVLSIWIYLLDLVKLTLVESTELTGTNEVLFEYVYTKKTCNQDEALAQLESTFYHSCRITKEEVVQGNHALDQELHVIRKERDSWKQRKDKFTKKFSSQVEELSMLETKLIGNELKTIDKEIGILQNEFDFNREKLVNTQYNLQQKIKEFEKIRMKNQSTGCDLKECEQLDAELGTSQRRLHLLRTRKQKYEEHNRALNKRLVELSAEIETRIFDHNTRINMSVLSKRTKNMLLIHEKNINPNEVDRVAQGINNCKKLIYDTGAEMKQLNIVLNDQNNELHLLHQEETNQRAELDRIQKEFQANALKLNDLKAEQKAKEEVLENKCPQVDDLKNLMTAALEKHRHALAQYNRKKAEIERILCLMQTDTIKHRTFVKDQVFEFEQMNTSYVKRATASVESVRDALLAINKKG